MYIDLSPLLNVDLWPFAGSQVTHGQNASLETWEAAKGAPYQLLTTPEQIQATREHLENMGMDDLSEMPDYEINAVFIQLVTNDLRDIGETELCETENIREHTDGKFYYYLGF